MLDDEDDEDDLPRRARRRFRKGEEDEDDMDVDKEEEQLESIENLADTRGMDVSDWVSLPGTRNEILNRFKHFLKTFTDEKGNVVYRERIRKMVQSKIVFQ